MGELSEIFQWKGEVSKGLPGWEARETEHLGEELGDVLLYLVCLSDMCGVDLGKAALRKMELNTRKYPAGHGSGSSRKHTHTAPTTVLAPARTVVAWWLPPARARMNSARNLPLDCDSRRLLAVILTTASCGELAESGSCVSSGQAVVQLRACIS